MTSSEIASKPGAGELQEALNQIVYQNIEPVSSWLAVLYALFSVSHPLILPGEIAPVMSMLAGLTAIIFLGIRIAMQRMKIPRKLGHPLAAGMVGLVLLNSLVHMALTDDVHQTTNLMLAFVGASFFILATRWFVLIIVCGVAAWWVIQGGMPSSPQVGHFGFGLFTSIVLSGIVHSTHLRTTKNLEQAHLQEAQRAREYGRFYSVSLDMLGTVGFDGYLKRINFAFERILGYKLETIYGKPIWDLVHPDDLYITQEQVKNLEGGTEIEVFENRLLCGDGTYKWILWNAVPLPEQNVYYLAGREISQRKQMEENLQRINRELLAFNAIMSALTASLEPDNVFKEIVYAVKFLMPHVRGASLQVMEGNHRLITRARTEERPPEITAFYLGEGAAGQAISQAQIINIADVRTDPRFKAGSWEAPYRSLLAVPLIAAEKAVGVISVESDLPSAFGAEEERRVGLLANFAAVAIENSRLYHENAIAQQTLKDYTDHLQEIVEARTADLRAAQEKIIAQKRLEQEVELAQQVQASLLSQEIPQVEGFVFAATGLAARYVGGDFYDFITKDGMYNVVLADVSGKGIPAAMLTSTARALVRAAFQSEDEPGPVLDYAQKAIYSDLNQAEMFATFFAARLDPIAATLTYANAGHTEAIWMRYKSQTVELLSATGLPIGIISDNQIAQKKILLAPGDALVFYSDGITETFNPQDKIFGLERLVELVYSHSGDSAHTLAQRILTEVDVFADGAPLADDLTLVVLKVMPRTITFDRMVAMKQLDEITAFVRRNVEVYGDDFAYQVELMVSELVTNIIKYSYRKRRGRLRGEILLDADGMILKLFDQGLAFDISQLPEVNLHRPHAGGYGLHIVRQLADELNYIPGAGNENCWRIVKKIPRSGE